MYFGLRETITRKMTENFREIKVASNSVFMSIITAKTITDSWQMSL